jgi:arylsulfatase A-like enzyme
MKLKLKISFLATLAVMQFLSGCSFKKGNQPDKENPNIIIIYLDDMGYGDIGPTGATGYQTPNIDKLVYEGMFFSNFYAPQATCSASRAGLMSGCYPNRVGIGGALSPHASIGLNPDEEIIPELLKKKNYKTAIIGKWHLGDDRRFLPLQHGFDEYLGLPYSNDMWPVNYDGTPATPENHQRRRLYPSLPLISGNETIREIKTLQDQSELTTIYTEKAVDYIKQNQKKPFFIYLAHSMPHVPLAVSEKFKGKSEQGLFGDVMMELDWSVGQIVETLEECRISDNTLIIFTSDNGPWINYGNHAGSTGGLREGKGTSFEGGQRVACIMKWPRSIPAGKICNKIASSIDILPTLARITDAPMPKRKIDGVDISSLMKGDKDANPRECFYYYYQGNCLEAVRNGNWKLILPHKHRSYVGVMPGNNGFPGKYANGETGLSLYNLRRDRGEQYDVKELYPAVVERLMKIVDQARKDLGDDLTGDKGANRREPGKLKTE